MFYVNTKYMCEKLCSHDCVAHVPSHRHRCAQNMIICQHVDISLACLCHCNRLVRLFAMLGHGRDVTVISISFAYTM